MKLTSAFEVIVSEIDPTLTKIFMVCTVDINGHPKLVTKCSAAELCSFKYASVTLCDVSK